MKKANTSHTNNGKQKGFWSKSPFLGLRPDSLALVETELESAKTAEFAGILKAVLKDLRSAEGKFELRWQVGIGANLFSRCKSTRKPLLLKELKLNGDEQFTFETGCEDSDILICFAGSWENVTDAAKEILPNLEKNGLAVRSVNIGHDEQTERDHSGFLDGTSNLQELTPAQFSKCVFVQKSDDKENAGGSYLIYRKYEEDLEMWNDLPDYVQEHFIGREKNTGAFMNKKKIWSPEIWKVTAPQAHIKCANPRLLDTAHKDFWKERIYRRGIKFTERKSGGALCYGLHFLALVRNPEEQFVRIHNERILPNKGAKDFLMSSGYINPLRSGCFFLPASEESLLKMVGK